MQGKGVLQHVVGGVDFDRLGEEAYSFIKFAGGEGVVALLFELFSHDFLLSFDHNVCNIFTKRACNRTTAAAHAWPPCAAAPSLAA